MRILLAEDEPVVAGATAAALRGAGHAVDHAADGDAALEFAAAYDYDMLIVDVIMPRTSGLKVAARLRGGSGRNSHTPLLMLTALGGVDDRVAGLDLGADDYMVKPFAMAELLARVRALRRRRTSSPPAISVDDLVIDPASQRVTRGGKPITLTAREFALLEVLARNPGHIYSQQRLIDAVWDATFESSSNVVEVYVRSLRRKLDSGRRDGLIRTVRGAGYKLSRAGEA